MTILHVDIPSPIKCLVNTSVFYDMKTLPLGKPAWTPCVLFAMSSYEKSVLTFKVMVEENGALFDFVPVHMLKSNGKAEVGILLELSDLVSSKICESMNITVHVHQLLTNKKKMQCFFKDRGIWLTGRYHCTVDWYDANENAHLVELENGQFALMPNHKCVVGDKRELPDYVKLQQDWKL